jgi:hypothetical protein
MRYQEAN